MTEYLELTGARYVDLARWPRRGVFEFFRDFDKPYFNICTRLDVTELLTFLRSSGIAGVSLAYHYFALRAANAIEPFRYRLRDGRVLVHPVIHGGTTVLLPNESFALAYFEYTEDFEKFACMAGDAINAARSGDGVFRPHANDDMIHFTTLPWVSFTSMSHARNWGREDAVPKIAFGKFERQNERVLLPFSVEVHHALMDGFHMGQYLTLLEELIKTPERYLAPL